MSLLEAIGLAVRGEEVPPAILEAAFGEIVDGDASPARIAALLVATPRGGRGVY